jgi:subtilisin-like proprotein convertase family protein
VNVKLYIQHAYRGDLKVTLAHAGKTVLLRKADPTDSAANLYITYDLGTNPVEPLSGLEEDGEQGDWVLTVEDTATLSGGKLIKWSLFMEHESPPCNTGAQCNDNNPCTIDQCSNNKVCKHTADTCVDMDLGHPNLCTTDSCDAAKGGCLHAYKSCDDGLACTSDSCDTLTGKCVNAKLNNCTMGCTNHAQCGLDDYCDTTAGICKPIPGTAYHGTGTFPKSIPDNQPADLTEKIAVTGTGKLFDVNAKVLITHPYSGDLTVTLSNGTKTIYLRKQTGGATDNVYAVYDLADAPDDASDMSAYVGMNAAGIWTLTVHDWVSGDSGTLDAWSLHLVVLE